MRNVQVSKTLVTRTTTYCYRALNLPHGQITENPTPNGIDVVKTNKKQTYKNKGSCSSHLHLHRLEGRLRQRWRHRRSIHNLSSRRCGAIDHVSDIPAGGSKTDVGQMTAAVRILRANSKPPTNAARYTERYWCTAVIRVPSFCRVYNEWHFYARPSHDIYKYTLLVSISVRGASPPKK